MSNAAAPTRATVTRDGNELVITRTFAAPAALVYEAMTTPEHVRQWWGAGHGEVTTCEIDLRVGGRWHFAQTTPDGGEVSFSGEYRELDPPGRMVHTEVFDNIQSPESVIESTFTEEDGRTTLTAVITYDSAETVDMVLASGMEGGMNDSYDALEKVAQGLAT
ncbi:Uncharacterized conserved protein YndB, AHSA1/START domain [Pedococcus dokdonensis]|uniref:Uncharacterized conserved protein YndB, AHSA1/START domain n=1 Tax=Pedococcus dokdonensis TaxID=443156 RepID=A0A1H0QHM4_9MICO|nr:SRPBCC family protein [Pedococcus dokdonensis]SDP16883.1 Uncharacterized conserved protein YndB, AHSA1/START domain [Pedococcus dokdonensis]